MKSKLKIGIAFLFIIMFVITTKVSGANEYTYEELSDGTIEITEYNGSSTEVTIPSTINGKTVTRIGRTAFLSTYSLKKVTIPNTVKEIGSYAFAYCYNLQTINLADSSVEIIEPYAFSDCNTLEDLIFPDSLKTVGSCAFQYCYQIKNVEIGKGLTDLSPSAFEYSQGLKNFTVNSKNTAYSSSNGVLYNKDKTVIIKYPVGKEETSFTIPSTVKTVGKYCFTYANKLQTLVVPDSVTKIEYAGLAQLQSLKKLILSKNIEIVEGYAFNNITLIEEINLGPKVNNIDATAFISCEKLKNINIDAENATYKSLNGVLFTKDMKTIVAYPAGKTDETYTIPTTVTTIGDSAFIYTKITSITIPSNVTKLGNWCFSGTKITSITIPSTVTEYGDGPFSICDELTKVIINSEADLPYQMFDSCSNLSSVKLNNNIKNLNSRAFYGCTALTNITLPENLETIQGAFYNCTGLEKVVIPAGVKKITSGSFASNTQIDISKTKLIKLPSGDYAVVSKIYVEGTYCYDKAFEALELINKERAAQGKSALKMDKTMIEASMQRAAELSIYFDHTRTDGTDYRTLDSNMMGENIAAGYVSPESVVEGWMNSPPHKMNILTSDYIQTGIGCFYNDGRLYWVQNFGYETPTLITQAPSNTTKTVEINVIDEYLDLKLETVDKEIKIGEKVQAEKIININTGWRAAGAYLLYPSAKWTTSDKNIATVDNNGNVKGIRSGQATITATVGGKSISYTVNVKLPFIDVKETDWYYDAVKYTYENGIIKGATDTEFRPSAKLTRGMLVTILWRMEKEPEPTSNNNFPDVKSGQYYYKAITWASKNKIVSGYNSGNFGPNDNITREQLAVILRKYANYKGKDISAQANISNYKDASKVSSFAKESMQWAIKEKVMSGKDNATRLDPQGTASRAEAAGMISNYCKNI